MPRQLAVIRRAGFQAGLVLALRGVRGAHHAGNLGGAGAAPAAWPGAGLAPRVAALRGAVSLHEPSMSVAAPGPAARRGSSGVPTGAVVAYAVSALKNGAVSRVPRAGAPGGGVALLGLASEACPVGAAP